MNCATHCKRWKRRAALLLAVIFVAVAPNPAAAQGVAGSDQPGSPADQPEANPTAQATAPAPQRRATTLGRWVEIETATIGARYLFVDTTPGITTNSEMQHNVSFKSRVKFDPQGRLAVHVGVFTGNNFAGGWNSSGWGTGKGDGSLFLKQLYLAARPAHGVALQYGGLGVLRGEMSDITSYSGDGYVTGERMTLERPRQLFFDQIAVTYGYLGDVAQPGMNKRFHRLTQSNYHQFLVSKKLGERAAVSVDYTFESGIETLREGVSIHTKELSVIDWFRFDNYQRLDVNAAYGFGLYGEKAVLRRLTLGGGYVDIDRNYGDLNSDAFFHGRRLYAASTLKLPRAFSVSCLWNRTVANHYFVANRTHLHVIFQYDVLKGLQH